MRKQKIISALLALTMVAVTGCGNPVNTNTGNDNITLVDPVTSQVGVEQAALRTLYNASTYTATILPYVEEYCADTGIVFSDYGAFPGETVSAGSELIKSNTESVDDKIKAQQEKIKNMDEAHTETVNSINEQIEKLISDQKDWQHYVTLNENVMPGKDSDAYASWKLGYDYVETSYRLVTHRLDMAKEQLKQMNDLYTLDRAHAQDELANLRKQRKNETITSKMDGVVAAVNILNPGDYLPKDRNMVAVADVNQKILKCDYIEKTTINKAVDLYAYINGKRYEVEYQTMEPEEYLRLTAQNEKVYTTFTLLGAEDVSIGDFAILAVVKDKREQVVTIPKNSIKKDDSGNFVYIVRDGENVYTPIRTGMSDGIYTEILSGVNEGDAVLYNGETKLGKTTAKVTKDEFHTEFSNRALMYYPSSTYLTNPIENGTVYFGESKVQQYQHINKGDVVCTVRVVRDNIGLARNENQLKRLNERIADINAKIKKDNNPENYEDALKNLNEQAEELNKTIAKQKADFKTTQIVADKSGIITNVTEYKYEDIVGRGENIIQIADESKCYIVTEDEKGILQFGNTVSISYQDEERQDHKIEGNVTSLSSIGVSGQIETPYTFISIPEDKVGEILQTSGGMWDYWNPYRYNVSGALRSMNNCLVVPKSAVKMTGDKAYVYIKKPDGSIVAQSIIVGGYNSTKLWILEGVTEGMELCLD